MGLAKRGVLPFYRFTGKMAKHVCSCHGTQCFQRNSRSSGGGVEWGEWKEGGGKREKALKESGGHMSPLLLSAWISQAFVLNIDAEAENKPCPNTGVGSWTGKDRPRTRLSLTKSSSLSIQLWSLKGQTSTLTSSPDSQLPTPTS